MFGWRNNPHTYFHLVNKKDDISFAERERRSERLARGVRGDTKSTHTVCEVCKKVDASDLPYGVMTIDEARAALNYISIYADNKEIERVYRD